MSIERKQIVWLIFIAAFFVNFPCSVIAGNKSNEQTIWNIVKNDYQQFYYSDRLIRMGIAFGAGAMVANTSIDENFKNWYQDDVRSSNTDNFSKFTKMFGEGKYLIPLSLLLASVEHYFNLTEDVSAIGDWGKQSTRAYLIGVPTLLLMQRLTGASRPDESENTSHWNSFNDDNGVSGHAYIGAVPFLTIARMHKENRAIKYLFYAVSTLTALSRINDNAHYVSQSALGWYIAWEATDTIYERNKERGKLTVKPLFSPDSYGVTVSMIL